MEKKGGAEEAPRPTFRLDVHCADGLPILVGRCACVLPLITGTDGSDQKCHHTCRFVVGYLEEDMSSNQQPMMCKGC